MAWHLGEDFPEWGAAPRGNLVRFDRAHQGEWLESVIGKDPATNINCVYHILKCEYCITIHAWPIASAESLKGYYQRKFYEEIKPRYLQEYGEDAEWWMAIHRTVFDAAMPWLKNDHVSMLDIGAGPGYPLKIGAERGYNTTALEPSQACADWLRNNGHEVFEMTLEDFHANVETHGCFDLLYAWECL